MKRFIWQAFSKSANIRAISLGLTLILFAGAAYETYVAFSQPIKKTEQVPVVTYTQDGRFGTAVNIKPENAFLPSLNQGETAPIFMNLVESINIMYTYKFVADKTPDMVTTEVEVVAVLENPNVWKKEIVIFPLTPQRGF